ncbi:unnamed protein product [Vitrella brassicaformis CCMP3155]|uniref:Uncharacterized protein n=1 Tax=Vitrella brassicaformis (strain CCMP3155) TaxID=1169540 RepID=A0A0G4FUZ0_VITBC|nr:unnamed protein product [Vitrella brassicaformis CCMP3155]|eukprot:CEM18714.1 unnamed protein product [Vitrella brassicaformis CCMP3155]
MGDGMMSGVPRSFLRAWGGCQFPQLTSGSSCRGIQVRRCPQPVVWDQKVCRFKEMLELEVRQKPSKQSQLGVTFHIQDLVGRGTLHRILTASGDLLRLAGEVQNRQMTWA